MAWRSRDGVGTGEIWGKTWEGRRGGNGGVEESAETSLSALEQEDGYLTQVKVNEMSGFVRHVAPKVATHDAMPRWIVLLIKLLLDECSNVLKGKIVVTTLH